MGVRGVFVLLAVCIGCQEPSVAPPSMPKMLGAPAATEEPAESILKVNVSGEELKKLLAAFAESQKENPFSFAHLKKNALRYQGRIIAFSGKILEIVETPNDTTVARIALNGDADYVFWVEAGFTTDFVDDSRVDVIGNVAGAKTYQSQAGWTITVPAVLAMSIQKRGTFDRLAKPKRKGNDE